MITRNIETDVPISPQTSLQVTPLGKPTWGRPLGTGPSVATPCELRPNAELTMIVATTATKPPGITLIHRSKTTSVTSTATDTASVAPDVCPISPSVLPSVINVPLVWSTSTFGLGTPSMPPT